MSGIERAGRRLALYLNALENARTTVNIHQNMFAPDQRGSAVTIGNEWGLYERKDGMYVIVNIENAKTSSVVMPELTWSGYPRWATFRLATMELAALMLHIKRCFCVFCDNFEAQNPPPPTTLDSDALGLPHWEAHRSRGRLNGFLKGCGHHLRAATTVNSATPDQDGYAIRIGTVAYLYRSKRTQKYLFTETSATQTRRTDYTFSDFPRWDYNELVECERAAIMWIFGMGYRAHRYNRSLNYHDGATVKGPIDEPGTGW